MKPVFIYGDRASGNSKLVGAISATHNPDKIIFTTESILKTTINDPLYVSGLKQKFSLLIIEEIFSIKLIETTIKTFKDTNTALVFTSFKSPENSDGLFVIKATYN